MTNDISKQIKLEAFRQHWEQLRHIENVRLAFNSFYIAVVAGVFSFIAQVGVNRTWWLFSVLSGLSLLGVWECWRLFKVTEEHRDDALFFVKDLTGLCDKEAERYIPFKKSAKLYCPCANRIAWLWIYGIAFIIFLTVSMVFKP